MPAQTSRTARERWCAGSWSPVRTAVDNQPLGQVGRYDDHAVRVSDDEVPGLNQGPRPQTIGTPVSQGMCWRPRTGGWLPRTRAGPAWR